MQKTLTGLTILIVGILCTANASADLSQDILACHAQQNDADRLDCYDSVTKNYKLKSEQTTKSVSPATIPAATKVVISDPKPLAPTEQLTKTTATTEDLSKTVTDAFGQTKTKKEKEQELQSIQSRLVGTFTEWKKGMKITLENGQVWKVTTKARGYKKLKNPIVTISRGIFSSFNARVEGLNAIAKVKRIK